MVRSMVSVREELLPPIWKNSRRKPMIWCEKAGNLVQRQILAPFCGDKFSAAVGLQRNEQSQETQTKHCFFEEKGTKPFSLHFV